MLRPARVYNFAPLRGQVVLDLIFFEKRDDFGNIHSNPNVQKLMLCNLSPLIRNFWLKTEW